MQDTSLIPSGNMEVKESFKITLIMHVFHALRHVNFSVPFCKQLNKWINLFEVYSTSFFNMEVILTAFPI